MRDDPLPTNPYTANAHRITSLHKHHCISFNNKHNTTTAAATTTATTTTATSTTSSTTSAAETTTATAQEACWSLKQAVQHSLQLENLAGNEFGRLVSTNVEIKVSGINFGRWLTSCEGVVTSSARHWQVAWQICTRDTS